ncbi:hypothetical protein EJB05_09608, partial [Eragrostis curvula]
MLLWRAWSVRNGVLKAGEKISICGSVEFLKRYMDALLQIRQNCDVRHKGEELVGLMSLELDCSTVLAKLLDPGGDRSEVFTLIHDALQEKDHPRGLRFVKISRGQNKIAHELAQLAVREHKSRVCFNSIPRCIRTLVSHECVDSCEVQICDIP